MRRPLNWIVVCLSMLFLAANLPLERRPADGGQTTRFALLESEHADIYPVERSEPKFGYVRADGSFLPLEQQTGAPAVDEVGAAVYEWSPTNSF